MDLKQLDTSTFAEAGFDLVIKHPKSGKDLDTVITLRGMDSASYRDKTNAQAQARLERNTRRGKIGSSSPEEIQQEALELLAAMTLGWKGVEEGGTAVPFSESAAVRLYGAYPWIREQVDAAVHDRANFLPQSAKG